MQVQKIEQTLKTKDGAWCLSWATVQQIVVACSTYFIIAAIRETTANHYHAAIWSMALFVGSLIVVYLPNTISLMYLQRWRLGAFGKFVDAFADVHKGLATMAHRNEKREFEPWLTNESFLVYQESTEILYHVYSTFLNSALNILVISVVIDRRLITWYIAAATVLLISNHIFRGSITRASLQVQTTRKNLASTMLIAWENIFVGNTHNLQHWQGRFSQNLTSARKSAVSYDVTRSLISSTTVSIALLVIGWGNATYLFEHRSNISDLAALIVTLPRQVQIIQNIFAFFNIYLSWKGVRSRLDELTKLLSVGNEDRNPEQFINFREIYIEQDNQIQNFTNTREFSDFILNQKCGRITLRGGNGTGKSTLLSLFSEKTGSKSFFLPSKFSNLAFAAPSISTNSDGERVLAVFHEISGLSDIQFVLLDEWDANLDHKNLSIIDRAIEDLSKHRVVIESRHRGPLGST